MSQISFMALILCSIYFIVIMLLFCSNNYHNQMIHLLFFEMILFYKKRRKKNEALDSMQMLLLGSSARGFVTAGVCVCVRACVCACVHACVCACMCQGGGGKRVPIFHLRILPDKSIHSQTPCKVISTISALGNARQTQSICSYRHLDVYTTSIAMHSEI